MKVAILLCLLVAGAQAFDCDKPDTLNALEKMLCAVKDTATQVGGSLLNTLEQTAIQAATQLGGQLIDGLQQVAAAATATDSPQPAIGKRTVDMATVIKVAGFVEQHRELVDDLYHLFQNVTQATVAKLDGLIKEFTNNPNEEVFGKIVAYVKAHHLIQNGIDDWIDKNVSPLPAFALKELIATQIHKRDTSALLAQAEQFGSQLAGSFGPLVNTLKTLVGGLGDQLLSTLGHQLPNAQQQQLAQAFQPHLSALAQDSEHLLDTVGGGLEAVKEAAGNILEETLRQSAGAFQGIVSQVASALQSLLNQQ